MKTKPIIIVQGAQYGSEAKGAIAAYICETEKVDIAVRTGATNAGHTVWYKGKPYKMQQLPVGWVNPQTQLVLGAGALIDPAILAAECKMVTEATGSDVQARLTVDYHCGIHEQFHKNRSTNSGRHYSMGATGKGCSEALIDKIARRGNGYVLFGESRYATGYSLTDTARHLNRSLNDGAKVMLEGTQGTMLDLHIGPYPYVTHKQTGPAVWMAEAGLSPALPVDIVMVVRTYPIRVAGNSGPLPAEISWPELARSINDKLDAHDKPPLVSERAIQFFESMVVETARKYEMPPWSNGLDQHTWDAETRVIYSQALSEVNSKAMSQLPSEVMIEVGTLFEMTTVTKKLRRIANINFPVLRYAGALVRPTRVALTFANYINPEYWWSKPPAWIDMWRLGDLIGAPVTMVTYGPRSEDVLDIG